MYEMLQHRPSVISASAVYLALKTSGQTPWVRTPSCALNPAPPPRYLPASPPPHTPYLPIAIRPPRLPLPPCLSCYAVSSFPVERGVVRVLQTAELQRHSTYTEADLQVYSAHLLCVRVCMCMSPLCVRTHACVCHYVCHVFILKILV